MIRPVAVLAILALLSACGRDEPVVTAVPEESPPVTDAPKDDNKPTAAEIAHAYRELRAQGSSKEEARSWAETNAHLEKAAKGIEDLAKRQNARNRAESQARPTKEQVAQAFAELKSQGETDKEARRDAPEIARIRAAKEASNNEP